MLPDWVTGTWLLALDWAIRLAALLWIPARTTPGAARSWLLLVGFVPVVGLPLYLLFGHHGCRGCGWSGKPPPRR